MYKNGKVQEGQFKKGLFVQKFWWKKYYWYFMIIFNQYSLQNKPKRSIRINIRYVFDGWLKNQSEDWFQQVHEVFSIKIDVDLFPELTQAYEIKSTPTFKVINSNGDVLGQSVGGSEANVNKIVNIYLENKNWFESDIFIIEKFFNNIFICKSIFF